MLLGTNGVGEVPANVTGTTGEVWILDRCDGGGPGSLLHVYTTGGGGIDLDETISLANLVPKQRSRVGSLQIPRCGLAATGRSAWVATNIPPGLVRVDYSWQILIVCTAPQGSATAERIGALDAVASELERA